MKMKKFLAVALIFCIGGFVFAQSREIGTQDPGRIGIETAQEMLREISVDRFEHEGFWKSSMSSDEGYTTTRLFIGSAPVANHETGTIGKEPIPEEEGYNIQDVHVLGTRVDFLRRGYSSFYVYPTRPIPIEGITKTVSVWVAGRNFNHKLYLLIQDFFGRNYEFLMQQGGGGSSLNFTGWQRMYATIQPSTGYSGVVQRSVHYQNNFGIKIMGFRIDCDPLEARGSYYIYFDDLRAVVDLFAEYNRDPHDMIDGW